MITAQLQEANQRNQIEIFKALHVLAEMGPKGAEHAHRLPSYFDSDHDGVAVRSAVAYWRLTGDPNPVLPILLEHVECAPSGFEAVECLAEIGLPARAVLPRLKELVESDKRQVVIGDTNTWIEVDEAWQKACQQAIEAIER